jgi:hypothetical protein
MWAQEEAQRNGGVEHKERVEEVGGEAVEVVEVVGSIGRASPVVEPLIAAKAGGYSITLHSQFENRMSSSFSRTQNELDGDASRI